MPSNKIRIHGLSKIQGIKLLTSRNRVLRRTLRTVSSSAVQQPLDLALTSWRIVIHVAKRQSVKTYGPLLELMAVKWCVIVREQEIPNIFQLLALLNTTTLKPAAIVKVEEFRILHLSVVVAFEGTATD